MKHYEKFDHLFKWHHFAFQSKISVHIIKDDEKYYILFEDLNMGTSVTNATEQLATEIVSLKNLNPDDCRFFEHYPEYDSFDEITYSWKNKDASKPQWRPATDEIINMFKSFFETRNKV